jgi:hypothetical protein
MPPRPRTARKLLVASLGVAAIAYAGCEKKVPPGNLMAPPPPPPTEVVGNLMPMPVDAGPPTPMDAGVQRLPAIQVK